MGFARNTNIVNDGLVFGYDADDRSTRFYHGEPTTNVVPNANIMSGWTPYVNGNDGTFITEFGTTGYKIINRIGWNGISKTITLPSTGTYTVSGYIRYWGGDTAVNGGTVYTSGGGLGDQAEYADKSKIGVWQRVSMTRTFTSTSLTLFYISYGGNSTTEKSTWDITMPQIEQKSHATQFVNGTRSITQGLIDLKRNTTIDLSNVGFDSTAHPIWDGTDTNCIYSELNYSNPTSLSIETVFSPSVLGSWRCVMHRADGATIGSSEFWIGLNAANSYITGTIGAKTGVAGSYDAGITNIVPVIGKYYHVVSTWNGSIVKTYVNNILKKAYTLTTFNNATDPTIRFGAANDNGDTYSFSGKIPVGKVYWDKVLTENEIMQNYLAYKTRFNLE